MGLTGVTSTSSEAVLSESSPDSKRKLAAGHAPLRMANVHLAASQSLPELRFKPARHRHHVQPRSPGVDLTVREALRLMRELIRKSPLPLRQTFQAWDGNKNGSLDIHELTCALIELGGTDKGAVLPFKPSDIKLVFDAFDKDGCAVPWRRVCT